MPIMCLVMRHLASLRRLYPRAVIFFYVEANMSWTTADRFATVAQTVDMGIRIVSRDRKGLDRPGVETTDVEKRHYADFLCEALSSSALVYARDFVSDNLVQAQTKFEEQMHQFRRIIIPSSDDGVSKRPKVVYSGQLKDDTIMAAGITGFHARITIETPEYQREAHDQGWNVQ